MSDGDPELLHGIIRARGGFGHREHLELAWTYLSRYELVDAERAMASTIRHLAAAHGIITFLETRFR